MAEPCNILITGGTDGIGLKLAQSYANSDNNVVVTGRRSAEDVKSLLTAHITYIMADQAAPDEAANAITLALKKLGWSHCDLAILNAGNGKAGDPLEESSSDLINRIDVNLTAPILISHALADLLMASADGKLVLIGSTSHKGASNFASYAASKAGLNGFARSLREEWRGRVNVQIIHPGPIATNMHDKAGFDPGFIKRIFLDPDFVAKTLIRKIKKGHSPVSISFSARIIDYLTLRNRFSS